MHVSGVWCRHGQLVERRFGGKKTEANRFASQSDSSVEDYLEFVVSGRGPLVNSSSVAVRKDVLDAAGGFREGLRPAEDVELWCRLTTLTSFAAFHRPMVVYFQDFSGNSTRDRLYVGDAPFSSLRNDFSEDRIGCFDQYLALWRMKSLALGTLLSGQEALVRRMALESLGSIVWGRSICFPCSILPANRCMQGTVHCLPPPFRTHPNAFSPECRRELSGICIANCSRFWT